MEEHNTKLTALLGQILEPEEISQIEYYMQCHSFDFYENLRSSLIHFYDKESGIFCKDDHSKDSSLRQEANYVAQIFPDVPLSTIYEYFVTFSSFDERKEIVLKILLKLYPTFEKPCKPKRKTECDSPIKLKIFKRDGEYASDVAINKPDEFVNWSVSNSEKPATITSGALTSSHTSNKSAAFMNWRQDKPATITSGALATSCTLPEPATSASTSNEALYNFEINPIQNNVLENKSDADAGSQITLPHIVDSFSLRREPIDESDDVPEVTSTTPTKPLLAIPSTSKVTSTTFNAVMQPAKLQVTPNYLETPQAGESVNTTTADNPEFSIDQLYFEPKSPRYATVPPEEITPTAQIIDNAILNSEQPHNIVEQIKHPLEGEMNFVENISDTSLGSETWADYIDDNVMDVEEHDNVDLTEEVDAEIVDEYKDVNAAIVSRILEMFPEACPRYVRSISRGKEKSEAVINDLINLMLENEHYPRRAARAPSPEIEFNFEQKCQMLQDLFPDADPDYLQRKCEEVGRNQEQLSNFIAETLEKKNYPTMKEYLRKQQMSAQCKQYTTEFSVEKFLQVIPDPEKMFNDPKYKINLDAESSYYLKTFLRNHFSKISMQEIHFFYKKHHGNLIQICKSLGDRNMIKSRRKPISLPTNIQNIPLLQVIAYVENKGLIEEHIKRKKEEEENEYKIAKARGLLCTCNCCFDDEIMPKNIFTCDNGCVFCRDCIKKSVEIASGEGQIDFPCLSECESSFSLQTLQSVLDPKLFSKIAQKKALAEIKAAGIEDLTSCPFCDFATILPENDKVFQCLNQECMKESCRQCKEPSHLPLRCEEVEKDQDVKARTFIENKMTEALLRQCYKCGKKFFKEEGCNKMRCSCGALMCYICKKPVKDYSHFNGQGGDKYHLCPLFSDTHEFNKQEVLKGAEAAQQEIGVEVKKLKVDPTADVAKHYDKRAKKQPQVPHVNAVPGNRPAHFQVLAQELGMLNRFLNDALNQRQQHQPRAPNHFHGHQNHRRRPAHD